MAACMGVRTDRVNMLTFAFGSGLAGLAGAFLSQIGNVGPSLGQTYIVDSFMTVVVGRRRQHRGHGLFRHRHRHGGSGFAAAIGSPVMGKIIVLGGDHPVPPMETGRVVLDPQPQPAIDLMRAPTSKSFEIMAGVAWPRRLSASSSCRALNAFTARRPAALHVSNFTINLYGKYLCYAILAISVDLLWGYTGLLSLGQASSLPSAVT